MAGFSFASGLGRKLLAWFLVMSLVPTGFIALVSYGNSSNALIMQLEKDSIEQAKTLGLQVDRLINERLHDLKDYSRGALFTSEGRSLQEKAESLSEVVGQEIACAYLFDANGNILISAGAEGGWNAANEPWFNVVRSGGLYYGDCTMSEAVGRPTIRIAAPIESRDGRLFLGAILEEIDMDSIQTIVDEVEKTQKAMGGTGYAFLVRKDGFLIAHPVRDKILKEQPANSGIRGLTEAIDNMLAGKEGMSKYTYEGVAKFTIYAPLKGYGDYKGNSWGIGVTAPAAELYEPVIALRNISIASILIIAIIVSLLAIVISSGIARPLRRVTEIAGAVAEGDLTVSVPEVRTRDEVEALAEAFNRMVSNLRHLVGELRSSAEEVASTSEELSASAEESAKAVQQISETVQQVASGAQEQSQSVATSASSVDQLTQAIVQVAKGTESQTNSIQAASDIMRGTDESLNEVLNMLEKVGTASGENARSASRGSGSVKNVIASMERIRGTTSDVAERIKELDSHSREIGRILEVIDDIAEQTNLLALNAAIEAARAGEHGRGFAVVADEVRKLAEHSSRETKAIADLVERVRQATEKAVAAIDTGTKEVETGSIVAQEAGNALDEIREGASEAEKLVADLVSSANSLKEGALGVTKAIDDIVSIAEENTAAAEEMATSAEEVKKSINNVAAVSEESAAATEEVSASTEEVNASIQEMSASAESLAEMAQRLQDLIVRFKV